MRRAWLLCALLIACGDDSPSADEPSMDGSTRPRLDAGLPMEDDADAAPPDEPLNLDAGDLLPSYSQCRGYLQTFHAAVDSERSFSSAIALNTIFVALPVATCGGSASSHVAEGIALVSLPTSGTPGVPVPSVNATDADCSRTELVTLQSNRGALSMYFASNRDGSPQIYAQQDGGTQTLSDAGSWPVDMAATRTALFYTRGNAIYVQSSGAAPQQLIASSDGYAIDRLAVSALGTSQTMFAWTSEAASMPGVFLSVLDANNNVSNTAQQVGEIGPQTDVALASQSKRGAVVWSDAQGSLYLRTVGLDGQLGEKVRLTTGNQFVSDVSIANYGIGYTIAFRATPMTSGQAVIRLLMVDDLGNAAQPRVISEARSDGRGLEVHVANDGRVVVIWSDPSDNDSLVRVARLNCL